MTAIYAIILFLWYVCVAMGLYFVVDYRIRAFLRETWLCWVFAFLWPVSIVGYMVFYLWERD